MAIRITRGQLKKMVETAIKQAQLSERGSKEGNLSVDAKGGEERDPHIDYDKDDAEHALDTMDEMGGAMIYEDSGEEEGRHYEDNAEEDEKHLRDLEKDMRYDKDHVREGRLTAKGFRSMIAQEIKRALKN
jgi:hypothetical protein